MTDRVKGLTVVLEENIRVDDIEPLVDAIRLMRGVQSVHLQISEGGDFIVECRVRDNLRRKMYEFIDKELPY